MPTRLSIDTIPPRSCRARSDLIGPALKTVTIHIGPHKTGSTTIQHFLDDHEDALHADYGVRIARTGRLWRGQNIGLGWQFNNAKRWTEDAGTWEELGAEIAAMPEDRVIVSSENFSLFKAPALATIAAALKPFRVRVVFYARRPDERLHSAYIQDIKNFKTVPEPARFVKDRLRLDRVSKVHTLLKLWSVKFGSDAIDLRVLEPGKLNGDDLVTDFLRVSGCGNAVDNLPSAKRENVAPGRKSLLFMYALGTTLRDRYPEREWWELNAAYSMPALNFCARNGWNEEVAEFFGAPLRARIIEAFEEEERAAASAFRPEEPLLFSRREAAASTATDEETAGLWWEEASTFHDDVEEFLRGRRNAAR